MHKIIDVCVTFELPVQVVLERVARFQRAARIRSGVNSSYVGSLTVLADDKLLIQKLANSKGYITRSRMLEAFFELRWPLRRLLHRLAELTPLGLKWQGLDPDLLRRQLERAEGWPSIIDLPANDDRELLRFRLPMNRATGFSVGWLRRHALKHKQPLADVVRRAKAWSEVMQWKMPEFDIAAVETITLTDWECELLVSGEGLPLDYLPYFPPALIVSIALRRQCTLREVCEEIVRLHPPTPPLPDIDWGRVEEPEVYRQDIEEFDLQFRSDVRLLDCLSKENGRAPVNIWRRLQKFVPLGLKVQPLDSEALEALELSPDDWALMTLNHSEAKRLPTRWYRGHALKAAFVLRRPIPDVLERMRRLSVLGLGDVESPPADASLEALDEHDLWLLGWDRGRSIGFTVRDGEPLTAELLRFVGWYIPDVDERIERFQRWGLLEEEPANGA